MKKVILLLCLFFQTTATVWACSCAPSATFCDMVMQSIKFNPNGFHVIKARTTSIDGGMAIFEVLDVLRGDERRTSIRVFRNRFLCPDAQFGTIGEIFIYLLNRTDSVTGNNTGFLKDGDYSLPSCMLRKLKVEAGFIIGSITESRPQMIRESDFICEGLNNNSFSLDNLKFTPNPFSNQLTIKGLERGVSVTVFDMAGRVAVDTFIGAGSSTLSLGHLASGMYIVRIQHLGEVTLRKIVKI